MRHVIILFGILSSLMIVTYGQNKDSVRSEEIVCYFDPMPTFPGGLESLMNFIKKNLKSLKGTRDYVGRVYVAFVITEDGSPTDFQIMRGLCDICDENALETLRKMPKWIPAKVKGKPISRRVILPIKYE